MAEANKTAKVTCPKCGAVGDAPIWDMIDRQQSKRDARHVLNESIFDVDCPRCGHRISLNYPLVYHDGEQRFLVYYVTSADAVAKAAEDIEGVARHMIGEAARREALEAKADGQAADAAARAAAQSASALDGYRMRIVTSRNALREKVAILRGDMDDRAIEVIKLATFNMAASQRKLKDATDAYYGGVSKAGALGIKFTGGRKYYETEVPMDMYDAVKADVEAYVEGAGRDSDPLLVDRDWALRFVAATAR